MTTVEYSVEVDAPPDLVWEVASDLATCRIGTSTS